MKKLTKSQAGRFILIKQGLIGKPRFAGKQGALEYIKQAGCIQFDPVDVCGKMAELTLQSRVKGFTKAQLEKLLYKDRVLFDYPDKQLSIIPTDYWSYYERYRAISREGGKKFPELPELEVQALAYIKEHGAVSADELPLTGKMNWHSHIHWSGSWGGETNIARSVLEQLYSTGKLLVHHKKGTRKYYDLAERYIPREILESNDPLPDDHEHRKWRIARRIGACGLLWDRSSGYFNNVWELTTEERHAIFTELLDEGKLAEASVEGVKSNFYYLVDDEAMLEEAVSDIRLSPRCEFIAPLDPFLWDKQLIKSIYGFEYSWEIYTPADKRKYGAYVLPILYGDRFIGRIEPVNNRKTNTLEVRNIWFEEGTRITSKIKEAINKRVERFAEFNGCDKVVYTQSNE